MSVGSLHDEPRLREQEHYEVELVCQNPGARSVNYYKATRPNGTDFCTGRIDYAAALESGEVIEHPRKMVRDDPSTYLSVSIHKANCTGMRWPCRLFRVEPVGRTMKAKISDSKRACRALRVVAELPAHEALGPQGEEVAALIERCRSLTAKELAAARAAAEAAARNAAWAAAWDARAAAGVAAGAAARAAARAAAVAAGADAWADARDAAWDAALALCTRDLITPEQFDTLYGPWREVVES